MSDTDHSDDFDSSNDTRGEENDSTTNSDTATVDDSDSAEYNTDSSSDTNHQNPDDTELETGTESDTDADIDIDAGRDTDTGMESDTQTGEQLCGTSIYDKECGLCWRTQDAPGTYQWAEGVKYCQDLVYEGHNDWRLPGLPDFDCLLGGCEQVFDDTAELYCDSCATRSKCSKIFTASQIENNEYHGGNTDEYFDICTVYLNGLIFPKGNESFYESVRCVRDI